MGYKKWRAYFRQEVKQTESEEDTPSVAEEAGHGDLVADVVGVDEVADFPGDQTQRQRHHAGQDHGAYLGGHQVHIWEVLWGLVQNFVVRVRIGSCRSLN